MASRPTSSTSAAARQPRSWPARSRSSSPTRRSKSILINIFGGITRGEEVANGIVTALGRVDIPVPIVIRLDGTNAEEGREILAPHLSDQLRSKPTMLDAAREAVALAAE